MRQWFEQWFKLFSTYHNFHSFPLSNFLHLQLFSPPWKTSEGVISTNKNIHRLFSSSSPQKQKSVIVAKVMQRKLVYQYQNKSLVDCWRNKNQFLRSGKSSIKIQLRTNREIRLDFGLISFFAFFLPHWNFFFFAGKIGFSPTLHLEG